jgi:hypothetical protein
MSQDPVEISSSSNYQLIFDNAFATYKKKTGNDLTTDPLLRSLRSCDSPDNALTILREQIPEVAQSRRSDHRLSNWLNPTVNVLYTFSSTLGGAVSLVSLNKVKTNDP